MHGMPEFERLSRVAPHSNEAKRTNMDQEKRLLIAQLRQFSVCNLADALGASCPIETSIRPLDPQFRICGFAFTVESVPGENLTLHHALHVSQAGDVLVVGGSMNCDVALWGELMSMSAQSKGLMGTIIDGPVRDPLEISALGYPVFSREVQPRKASKETYGRINVPIRLGKITVRPEDVILADANGIVCLPRARVQEGIRLAADVVQKERIIREQIRSGRTIFEIFSMQQYVTGYRK